MIRRSSTTPLVQTTSRFLRVQRSLATRGTPLWVGGLVAGLVLITGSGCEPPTSPMRVLPPGVAFKRPLPEGTPDPIALGETGVTAAGFEQTIPYPDEPLPASPLREVSTPSGLKIAVYKEGTGAEAKPGSRLLVHYTGRLESGAEFDSSRNRNTPLGFELGAGQMIKGFDEGLMGAKLGERRVLVIPPELGYGDRAQGPIPPNSTLIFDVFVVEVK
ncbi:peptidylprolyl isomerase FKBP-type [Isosphaera pallida ATCC 43644]|uniref:Peptidyl-prolyl cis-trans isomerase n=1 Tax=Isosphaera pallida (strain ATCC 43644 / DSM 9630 / IS1B) TaxID=575540 RepID=E8R2U9_ISOPI|nr:peptidylprolyl isomerase FKBP-type [Isosphaera pallida ATCC 43644]